MTVFIVEYYYKFEVRILNYRYYLYASGLLLTFILGVFLANYIVNVFAHGGDANKVHGCIDGRGNVAKVGESENCLTGETALDWKIKDHKPFICTSCSAEAFRKISGVGQLDMTYSYINISNADESDFSDNDFSNSIFNGVGLVDVDFSNTNLTNVTFSDGTDLTGADMTGTTRTGVTWSGTTCPDGTNSDSHSNTCEGYLTP